MAHGMALHMLGVFTAAALSSSHSPTPLLRLRGGSATLPRSIEKKIIADNAPALQSALEDGTIDATSMTDSGNSALHVACKHGAIQCADALLTQKRIAANAQRGDGVTSLMLAAQNGHAACVQRLLKADAAVNQQQAEGSAALHYATRHGRLACLAALLQARKVDVNVARADGLTACMIAAFEGQEPCLALLLEAKADTRLEVSQLSS